MNHGPHSLHYDVQHVIDLPTEFGNFDNVPAFFAYSDHSDPSQGLALVAVTIAGLTLSWSQVVRMLGIREYHRQRDFWNQWWADEGYPGAAATERQTMHRGAE